MARTALARRTGLPYDQARLRQRLPARSIPHESERQFMQSILDFARAVGWLVHHDYDARRATPGYPDAVLVHARLRRVVFIEFKSDVGQLDRDQQHWHDTLKAAGAEVYVFRPRDREAAIRTLLGASAA